MTGIGDICFPSDGGSILSLKTDTGYKIAMSGTYRIEPKINFDGHSIWIISNSDCTDYFAFVFGPSKNDVQITDNLDSEFTIFTKPFGNGIYVKAYAYLNNFDIDTYELSFWDESGISRVKLK